MKANELRIGNYTLSDKEMVTVSGIYSDCKILTIKGSVLGLPILDAELDPIPLTEEWLVRLGFENRSERRLVKNITIQKRKEIFYFIEADCLLDNNYYEPTLIISSVHQLQNLYFALTGTELIIKP